MGENKEMGGEGFLIAVPTLNLSQGRKSVTPREENTPYLFSMMGVVFCSAFNIEHQRKKMHRIGNSVQTQIRPIGKMFDKIER